MNKVSLYTVGRKLQDGNLYLLSIHDLEPSGLIVHAYDQINSKEYILPVSEFEMATSGIARNQESLILLISSVELIRQGPELVLQSNIETISKSKQRLMGKNLEDMLKGPSPGGSQSINELLVSGLVELCKVKPVGLDAVEWLGQWLIANNPNKPNVVSPDDD